MVVFAFAWQSVDRQHSHCRQCWNCNRDFVVVLAWHSVDQWDSHCCRQCWNCSHCLCSVECNIQNYYCRFLNSHWPDAGEVHTIAAVVDSDGAVAAVEIAAVAVMAGDAAAEAETAVENSAEEKQQAAALLLATQPVAAEAEIGDEILDDRAAIVAAVIVAAVVVVEGNHFAIPHLPPPHHPADDCYSIVFVDPWAPPRPVDDCYSIVFVDRWGVAGGGGAWMMPYYISQLLLEGVAPYCLRVCSLVAIDGALP